MRLQIYDSVKILFDNYKKKKILLLRYNLSTYGLFFKGQGFKQHVIQNAQKKKLAREIKKHLSVCIVKGRGYLLTNFSFLALVEDGVETINQGIYFENEIVIST